MRESFPQFQLRVVSPTAKGLLRLWCISLQRPAIKWNPCVLSQPPGPCSALGAALQPGATSHNLLLKLQLPTACCCWLPRGWSVLKKRRESRNWEYSQAHLLMKAYGIQDIVIHVVIGKGTHIFMVPLIMLRKFWNCSILMGHKHLPEVKVHSKYKETWIILYNYTHVFM